MSHPDLSHPKMTSTPDHMNWNAATTKSTTGCPNASQAMPRPVHSTSHAAPRSRKISDTPSHQNWNAATTKSTTGWPTASHTACMPPHMVFQVSPIHWNALVAASEITSHSPANTPDSHSQAAPRASMNPCQMRCPVSVLVKKYVNPATRAAIANVTNTIGLAAITALNAACTPVATLLTELNVPSHLMNPPAAAIFCCNTSPATAAVSAPIVIDSGLAMSRTVPIHPSRSPLMRSMTM